MTILTIQVVDKDGTKYVSHDNIESNWVAPDGPLPVPESNSSARFWAIDGDVDGYFCPGSGDRTYPHQKSGLKKYNRQGKPENWKRRARTLKNHFFLTNF